jgi:hypothetical protein
MVKALSFAIERNTIMTVFEQGSATKELPGMRGASETDAENEDGAPSSSGDKRLLADNRTPGYETFYWVSMAFSGPIFAGLLCLMAAPIAIWPILSMVSTDPTYFSLLYLGGCVIGMTWCVFHQPYQTDDICDNLTGTMMVLGLIQIIIALIYFTS